MNDADVETFRNPAYPKLGWVGAVFFLLAALVMVSIGGEDRVVATPLGVLFAVMSFAAYRAYVPTRVEASSAGIVVVNPLRTHELAWADVDRISSERFLALHRRDGTTLHCWAVQAANAARLSGRRSRADEVAERLRTIAAAAGTQVERTPTGTSSRRSAYVYAGLWIVTAVLLLTVVLGD